MDPIVAAAWVWNTALSKTTDTSPTFHPESISIRDFLAEPLDVQHAARELANQVKNYYLDKLSMQILSNDGEMTAFRRDLLQLIKNSSESKFRQVDVPIMNRLMDFYHEDVARDKVFAQCNTAGLPAKKKTILTRRYDSTVNVSYLGSIRKKRKSFSTDVVEFWFKKIETGAPLIYSVFAKNELLPWFRASLTGNMTITGTFIDTMRYDQGVTELLRLENINATQVNC